MTYNVFSGTLNTAQSIKSLGKQVGFGPGDIMLDGDPAPLHGKVKSSPTFRPVCIVAKQSSISATSELLFLPVISMTSATF